MIKWLLTRAVEDDNVRHGYELVYTPNITREELFKISGHLPLYEANQYPAMAAGHDEAGQALKPPAYGTPGNGEETAPVVRAGERYLARARG